MTSYHGFDWQRLGWEQGYDSVRSSLRVIGPSTRLDQIVDVHLVPPDRKLGQEARAHPVVTGVPRRGRGSLMSFELRTWADLGTKG